MFSGSIVALVTPFDEKGDVDEVSLRELIRWHLRSKTDGIVCCGTTGESPTLSEKEMEKILTITLKEAKGFCKIIAGTGTNDTKKSVERTSLAKDLGVDGVLVVAPYYNKPTQKGCIAHFEKIADVGTPLIIYHHPGRTGLFLQAETFKTLEEHPFIAGIKEASGSLETFKKIKESCSLPILSGDDPLTLSMMKMGAKGCISVMANLFPFEWKKMIDFSLKEEFLKAFNLQNHYENLMQAVLMETNPIGVKYALSLMGKCRPTMRLPLLEPEEKTKKCLEDLLKTHDI